MNIKAEVSTDKTRLDIEVIHSFLQTAYWCRGIPRDVVERAIAGSICFGMYIDGRQIGFARLITDEATFGYLADVFIVEHERGRGYGKALIAHVMHVVGQYSFRRTLLATADAHELYRAFGFTGVQKPERFMEIKENDLYLTPTSRR
jgi:GNAT superfamily N-acetyltransferase